jgi:hypothetical protein
MKNDEFFGGLLALALLLITAPIFAVVVVFGVVKNLYKYIWAEYVWRK